MKTATVSECHSLNVVRFGAHQGKQWRHVPLHFLNWIVAKDDKGQFLRPEHPDFNTAYLELDRRQQAGAGKLS